MNAIEVWIYNIVKDNPILKRKIVGVYQKVLSLIPQESLLCGFNHTVHEGYYYGFHDKSPFSSDGEKLLAHRVLTDVRKLQGEEIIEFGYFNESGNGHYRRLGITRAWNWQMASMLQWFGSKQNDLIVYNDIREGQHCSSVINCDGEIVKEMPFPVVHVSCDGEFAISYDFLDIEKAMPGYGLVGDINCNRSEISVWSTKTFEKKWSLSIEEIRAISPNISMDGAHHFFHHALFNPSGNHLFFLHRWLDRNGRRWTRLFTVKTDGSELKLQPMDEMVSHITWKNDKEIFSYLRWPNIGDGYFCMNIDNSTAEQKLQTHLNSDGHPTYDESRGLIITDTYPDRFRNQYLYLFNVETGKRYELMRANLPLKYVDELQIDMHPRLNPVRQIACVDGASDSGVRMCVIDFSVL